MESNRITPLDWLRIWISAITRPTRENYALLFGEEEPQRRLALVWLILGGFAAAALSTGTYEAPLQIMLATMACGLPIFAGAYVALTVVTARSALWMARQMGSGGSLDRMIYALAAVNTPMSVLSAVAYLAPFGNLLAYALAVYWLFLTVQVIRALTGLDWGRALLASAVFILLSLLVLAFSVGLALQPLPGG